jgi:hypothetical protein
MEKMTENFGVSKSEEKEKKSYKIKIVCSGCKKDMGEKEGGQSEGLISHSLCSECIKRLYPELAEK